MFCTNCGTELPEGARYCFKCGAQFVYGESKGSDSIPEENGAKVAESQKTDNNKSTPNKGLKAFKTIITIAGIMLCAGIIILVLVSVNKYSHLTYPELESLFSERDARVIFNKLGNNYYVRSHGESSDHDFAIYNRETLGGKSIVLDGISYSGATIIYDYKTFEVAKIYLHYDEETFGIAKPTLKKYLNYFTDVYGEIDDTGESDGTTLYIYYIGEGDLIVYGDSQNKGITGFERSYNSPFH